MPIDILIIYLSYTYALSVLSVLRLDNLFIFHGLRATCLFRSLVPSCAAHEMLYLYYIYYLD